MNSAKYYVEKLKLQKHPEGGWFKEVYRSKDLIEKKALNPIFTGKRNVSTSIYFLLEEGDFSAFHRIKSDETWHFYDGGKLEIYEISSDGELKIHQLGLNLEKCELPQITIPHGHYFASKTTADFTLVGCTVAPGFDFEDFEMPTKKELLDLYPNQKEIIQIFGMA